MKHRVLFTNLVTLSITAVGCEYIADFEKTRRSDASSAGASSQLGYAGTSAKTGVKGTSGEGSGLGDTGKASGGAVGSLATAGSASPNGGASTAGATATTELGSGGAAGSVAMTMTPQGGTGPFVGATTSSGGAAVAGANACGGNAGQNNTGGSSTQSSGTAFGGSITTGDALQNNGGAAGSSLIATGGAATGGTSASTGGNPATGGSSNRFRGGPCVASPDWSSVEVIAEGVDQTLYRRVLAGSKLPTWDPLVDLDGTVIDGRSDLDCSASKGPIHIVVLGKKPEAGCVLHATGSGTSYSAFGELLPGQSFNTTPAVLATGATTTSIHLAAVETGAVAYWDVPSASSPLPQATQNSFVAGVDIDFIQYDNILVGFENTGNLALYDRFNYATVDKWTSYFNSPPSGQKYQYSPAICVGPRGAAAPWGYPHLVVTAGDTLWYSTSDYGTYSFSAWQSASSVVVSTSPRCVVTDDGIVHIVALDSDGQLVYVHGTSGTFVTEQVPAY